jgi:hypothetical protein
VGTFTWPPAGTYTWPQAETFSWPRTFGAVRQLVELGLPIWWLTCWSRTRRHLLDEALSLQEAVNIIVLEAVPKLVKLTMHARGLDADKCNRAFQLCIVSPAPG